GGEHRVVALAVVLVGSDDDAESAGLVVAAVHDRRQPGLEPVVAGGQPAVMPVVAFVRDDVGEVGQAGAEVVGQGATDDGAAGRVTREGHVERLAVAHVGGEIGPRGVGLGVGDGVVVGLGVGVGDVVGLGVGLGVGDVTPLPLCRASQADFALFHTLTSWLKVTPAGSLPG